MNEYLKIFLKSLSQSNPLTSVIGTGISEYENKIFKENVDKFVSLVEQELTSNKDEINILKKDVQYFKDISSQLVLANSDTRIRLLAKLTSYYLLNEDESIEIIKFNFLRLIERYNTKHFQVLNLISLDGTRYENILIEFYDESQRLQEYVLPVILNDLANSHLVFSSQFSSNPMAEQFSQTNDEFSYFKNRKFFLTQLGVEFINIFQR